MDEHCEALASLVDKMTLTEAELILNSLRWKEDMCIYNDFGEHVWLKPCFLDGVRIGITDCCFASHPCPHHREAQGPESSERDDIMTHLTGDSNDKR